MKTRVLIVINDIRRALEHEWFVEKINRDRFEIEFALINSRGTAMDRFLESCSVPVWHYSYKGKKDLARLTFGLYLRMIRGRYHIVHTHLFESSLTGLSAAFMAGVKKRIMTRHYSDYHHVWFPGAVKYDRLLNRLATGIVAISENVRNILIGSEHVNPDKIQLIHHGIDFDEYNMSGIDASRVKVIRDKYRIPEKVPVVGAISRFTELKGLQFLIPAFQKILHRYPGAILVMANANGDYKNEILELLRTVPAENYRTIEFENDIAALYRVFSCFVHIPINRTAEAFGQTYIESLASRIPSVFTLSGVAPEFAIDGENCFLVPYCDSDSVYNCLHHILSNPGSLSAMTDNGYDTVKRMFDIGIKINKLEKLYEA